MDFKVGDRVVHSYVEPVKSYVEPVKEVDTRHVFHRAED